jgi:hypothetical protein
MQRGGVEGEITVWDSGECELWGPVRETEIPGTDPQAEHRQLDSEADLWTALGRVASLFDGDCCLEAYAMGRCPAAGLR